MIPKFDKRLYYFDKQAAERVCSFIENFCCNIDGADRGKLIELFDWQKRDVIYPVFGIKKKSDGLRKIRTVWLEVPKKSGKSTMMAALSLYMLCADGEPGAKIFGAAADKDQAKIIFEMAQEMVIMSPKLNSSLRVLKNAIFHPKSGSYYKAISAVANTKHGFNLHGIFFDEMHAQKDLQGKRFWTTLHEGVSGRLQPLTFVATNAGYFNTYPYELHDRAMKIRDGVLKEPSWHVVIYGAEQDADIFNKKVWQGSNPTWSKAIRESLEIDARGVKQQPSNEDEFKRLRLGIWVGSVQSWISRGQVVKCNKQVIPEKGRPVFVGLDVGDSRDFTACSRLFPPVDDDGNICEPSKDNPFIWVLKSFIPRETFDRRMMDENVGVRQWEKDGDIIVTPGRTLNQDIIVNHILDITKEYNVLGVGFDAAKAYGVVSDLEEKGIEATPFRQGPFTMDPALNHLEIWFHEEYITHLGNGCIIWQMDNVMIKRDGNENKWFERAKSKDKIDGPVSLANATMMYLVTMANMEEIHEPADYFHI